MWCKSCLDLLKVGWSLSERDIDLLLTSTAIDCDSDLVPRLVVEQNFIDERVVLVDRLTADCLENVTGLQATRGGWAVRLNLLHCFATVLGRSDLNAEIRTVD